MSANYRRLSLLLVCLFTCCAWAAPAAAADWQDIAGKIGPEDAIAVAAPDGTLLFAKHATRKQVPASTLKILTALVAFDQLGPEYRFPTRFYRDPDNNLIIKGYGDPMLVSEEVAAIAKTLSAKIDCVGDIVIDDTYFKKPVAIPGLRSQSLQPYDAPNGALCVNFNTVFFKTENGAIVSAEPQTPMLPTAKKRIRSAGTARGRILLSTEKSEISQYAGELFAHFLEKSGVAVRGEIRTGKVDPDTAEPVYRHRSRLTLREVVRNLMKYSNNFVANQLLLAAGAHAYGPPATLEKGVRAADTYARDEVGINPTIVEGSGISRKNRITASMFLKILAAFAPYHELLESDGPIHSKTGTLDGIRTRAGYVENEAGKLYRFAVLLNTHGKRAKPIVEQLAEQCLAAKAASAK
mgnify:CR=1 FL=1